MQPSDAFKLRKAFFHALGKSNTEATQEVYESLYKSLGNITAKDVWIDIIPYCETSSDADQFVTDHPDIGKKYTQVTLTQVNGSNGQAWYYKDPNDKWIRPWISPVDRPHETSNMPSTGFQLILYQEDGTYIPPTLGVWMVDYYSGMIYFQEGYTPNDQGWGNVKATFYVYIGSTLEDSNITDIGTKTEDIFTVDDTIRTNKEIELSHIPKATQHLFLFWNGIELIEGSDHDYTISSSTITFHDDLELTDGDQLLVKYFY